MSGLKLLYNLILKETVKGSGKASGILSIGSDIRKIAMNKHAKYVESAKRQGVDLDKLSAQEIKYMLEMNKPKGPTLFGHRVIDATSAEGKGITEALLGKKPADVLDLAGKKIDTSKPILGGKNVPEDVVTETIIEIKRMEPMDAMKEANKILKGDGQYKSLSKADRKKIVDDESVTDHIFERNIKPDPEDLAHGGRTGTGLNYLLGEDDQNSRVPFAMGKRAFLKWLGSGVAGIGAAKTGLFGLLKGGGKKKVVEEVVKQSTGSGTPPAYFFNLVKKIKNLGDDAVATQDKAVAKTYKDYTLQEDFAGNIEIMKKGGDDMFPEDVFMSYKVDNVPLKKGKKKSTKVEEYEEYTATPDKEGKMKDIEMGVPDEVVEEGTIFEDTIAEFTKKASGGRASLSAGGLAGLLGE